MGRSGRDCHPTNPARGSAPKAWYDDTLTRLREIVAKKRAVSRIKSLLGHSFIELSLTHVFLTTQVSAVTFRQAAVC